MTKQNKNKNKKQKYFSLPKLQQPTNNNNQQTFKLNKMTDPNYQDWNTVTFKKKKEKAANPQKAAEQARQQGIPVETVKKFNAGTNKQRQAQINAKKIEEASDDPDASIHQATISLNVAHEIQQARNAMGLTQKELATRINEKASIINDYESGRAVPENQILGKLERVLGVKLRGKK